MLLIIEIKILMMFNRKNRLDEILDSILEKVSKYINQNYERSELVRYYVKKGYLKHKLHMTTEGPLINLIKIAEETKGDNVVIIKGYISGGLKPISNVMKGKVKHVVCRNFIFSEPFDQKQVALNRFNFSYYGLINKDELADRIESDYTDFNELIKSLVRLQ